VIDYDYRGPVGVVLFNHGSEPFEVKKGDRVAQLILERICMADVVEVETLSETSRGAGGFGSTGVAGNVENQEASSKRLKGDSSMDGE
jgi:dUTP pyrophosphatase